MHDYILSLYILDHLFYKYTRNTFTRIAIKSYIKISIQYSVGRYVKRIHNIIVFT